MFHVWQFMEKGWVIVGTSVPFRVTCPRPFSCQKSVYSCYCNETIRDILGKFWKKNFITNGFQLIFHFFLSFHITSGFLKKHKIQHHIIVLLLLNFYIAKRQVLMGLTYVMVNQYNFRQSDPFSNAQKDIPFYVSKLNFVLFVINRWWCQLSAYWKSEAWKSWQSYGTKIGLG